MGNKIKTLRGEDERFAAYEDYCRHFKAWFAGLPEDEQDFLREKGIDKPEPYDSPRPRSNHDDDEEFFDPADLAVDNRDPRPIVDFDSVGQEKLRDFCDHFSAALVWVTRGQPDLYQMGTRMLAVLRVLRPDAIGEMRMPLPRSMLRDLKKNLGEFDYVEVGNFFWLPLDWIRRCSSLVQLGKRAYSAIYVMRGDLIDAATCAEIGRLDNKSRQAANKPIQEFSDTFCGINSLPMRTNETRRRCKQAQLRT